MQTCNANIIQKRSIDKTFISKTNLTVRNNIDLKLFLDLYSNDLVTC